MDGHDVATAWERLDHRFRMCLEQAWLGLGRRGLPVGAAVARDDDVLAVGRNRVYDAPGGADPLQGTPIAHAEVNALAALPRGTDLAAAALWTTHAPCPMCRAASDVAGLGAVHVLAADPSDEDLAAPWPESEVGDPWPVVANVLFLHNVAWVGGRDSAILERCGRVEPEVVALALDLLDDRTLIRAAAGGAELTAALDGAWSRIVATCDGRRARLA